MSELTEHLQNPSLGPMVELFILDASALGNTTYYFTNSTHSDGSLIKWNGSTFTPVPIKFTAMERTIQGAPPRPTLTIANANKVLHSVVVNFGDLVGAQITRYRTFEQFLDDMPAEDPTMTLAPDYLIVEQKTAHNKNVIQWSLSSVLDKEGMKLPKRQVLRDEVNGYSFPGAGLVRIR